MYLINDFKAYHNANYHDGDNTFDHITYATVEGDNTQFKETFVQDCYDHYIAGCYIGYDIVQKVVDGIVLELKDDKALVSTLTTLSDVLGSMKKDVYK